MAAILSAPQCVDNLNIFTPLVNDISHVPLIVIWPHITSKQVNSFLFVCLFLTHWSLGDLVAILKTAIFYIMLCYFLALLVDLQIF